METHTVLTQIGSKPESDFTQPLGMLSDCHKRIRYFLNALLTVVDNAGEGSLTPQRSTYLETALRYFRDAAPKHTADEEQSLFPRLRSINTPQIRVVLARMERLEAEHRNVDSLHQEVDTLVREWMTTGAIAKSNGARLRTILTELNELYDRHIALEEVEIFPLAATVLSDIEKRAMGREMAMRRGVESL
jgi:hemerythrin-like domain-containing protein